MKTPIADFVKKYTQSGFSRFHMPGHKGKSFLGCEKLDITEIDGADVLGSADGIIYESEKNASKLFKTAHTFYLAEGSTTAICAMLALVSGDKPLILAARNVHKAFIHACALLDYEVDWIMPENAESLLKCEISVEMLENKILSAHKKPAAVYITSPDYLGNIANISEIADICKKHHVPLFVDNAHGAYLGFLEKSLHPIHLGATVCCDSAHKTLPVLTGGAYLHISNDAPAEFLQNTRDKLSLFSSTSPSYLILQSLGLCNKYLADGFENKLKKCIAKTESLKKIIIEQGFYVLDTEPLKITVDAASSGYIGSELAEKLKENKIELEFYDNDFVVLMVSPQNNNKDFNRLKKVFKLLKPKDAKQKTNIKVSLPISKMSIRDAVFFQSETIDVSLAEGRICAAPTVSCPPALPIAISGEKITKEHINLFKIYGIDKIQVTKP